MPARETQQQTNKVTKRRLKSDDVEARPRVELSPQILRCSHCWAQISSNALQPCIQVAFSRAQNDSFEEDEGNPQPIRYTAVSDVAGPVAELLDRSVGVPVCVAPTSLETELPELFSTAELHAIKHTLMTINAYKVEREVRVWQDSLQFSQGEQRRWQKSYESQTKVYETTVRKIEDGLLEKEWKSTYNDYDDRERRSNWGQSSGIRAIAGTSAAGGVRPCPEYPDAPWVGLDDLTWFWDGSNTGARLLAKQRRAVRFADRTSLIP